VGIRATREQLSFPKINPKNLQKIPTSKPALPQTSFPTQSTTSTPQKHHAQHPFFPKTPSKKHKTPH
jgi:hypothetical protein